MKISACIYRRMSVCIITIADVTFLSIFFYLNFIELIKCISVRTM